MTDRAGSDAGQPRGRRRGVVAWAFYDWANSPYVTVIGTFIFSAYFASAIATDKASGTSEWGFMMGLTALFVAIASPVLGAIADRGGPRKPWLAACTAIIAAGSFSLWWATPGEQSIMLVLIAVAIATAAFELGMVFYNAMLPGLVSESWLGRVSGWAWALGYVGGLVCLIFVLYGFVQADPPLFGVSKEGLANVRISGPIVAIWIVLFSIPLFVLTPERVTDRQPIARAVGEGLRQIASTIREVRKYRNIVRFLLARMLFMDGINTVFIFGGIYASGTFGMSVGEVAMFGIMLNVTAGFGAFAFGWLDDRIGAKPTILLGIGGIVLAGVPLLITSQVLWFYILGSFIGLFFGPVQSASRSLMARMAPRGMETEMFGLYAFSGKATAFLGPWIVGVIAASASQRWALATVMPFIIIGGLLLMTVNTKRVDPDSVLD